MPSLKPRDLPRIKEKLSNMLKEKAYSQAETTQDKDMVLATAGLFLKVIHAEMLWVSQDMTALTRSAAQNLPEQTHNYPQEQTGIVLFDGGLGVSTALTHFSPDEYPKNAFGQPVEPRAAIDGVIWSYMAEDSQEPYLLAFSLAPMSAYGQPPTTSLEYMIPLEISEDVYEQVANLMKTMWLLTSQGDIATEKSEQVAKGGGKSRKAQAQRKDAFVRVVSVRKTEREYTPARDSKGKWQLDHRVLVRGHWRQQAYGKKRGLRKPLYVRPYIKGPEGEQLVIAPTVKVWN